MSEATAVIVGWLVAAVSVGCTYAILKRPRLAWVVALVPCGVYAAFLPPTATGQELFIQIGVTAYLLVMYGCVAWATVLCIDVARPPGRPLHALIGAVVCLGAAALLAAPAFQRQGRVDPAYLAWLDERRDLVDLSRLLPRPAERDSFAEIFEYLEKEGADFGAEGHVSGEDLVADSPSAPNPFPGVLTGQRYGRLITWPSDAPPGRVPLLWDLEDFRGSFAVVFLDGNSDILKRDELERAIDQLRKYGPVRRWNGAGMPPSEGNP